jgi:AcrR family transcriptional regulator
MSARMSARLAPHDWCDAGLKVLRDEGMTALTVDRLCTVLERTKGSFYHHFRDLDAFLSRLLARWENTLTEAPIAFAGAVPEPEQRGARLDEAVARLDHRLDLAVRAWALRDERARVAVARVDARRIAYLSELHAAAGADDAQATATLEYVHFLGLQQLCAMTVPVHAALVIGNQR